MSSLTPCYVDVFGKLVDTGAVLMVMMSTVRASRRKTAQRTPSRSFIALDTARAIRNSKIAYLNVALEVPHCLRAVAQLDKAKAMPARRDRSVYSLNRCPCYDEAYQPKSRHNTIA